MMNTYWCLLFCFLFSTAYVCCQTISHLKITPDKGNLVLLEGDQLQLECHAIYSEEQTVHVSFYKDGFAIVPGNDLGYETIYTEERVTFSGNAVAFKVKTTVRKNITQVSDKGRYDCTALDSVWATIFVHIFAGFSISANLLPEGTAPLKLHCTVDVPADIVNTVNYSMFWERDGKRIEENERISCYNGTLVFRNPTRSDMGIYQCVITFFPESAVEKQSLRPKPSFLRGGPQIDYYSRGKTVIVGESLELRCEASGFPTPTVTWFKDNQEIVTGSNMRIMDYGNRSSSLDISSISKMDEGTYVCIANNSVPSFKASANIDVTVKEKSSDVSSSLSVHGYTSILSFLLLTFVTFKGVALI